MTCVCWTRIPLPQEGHSWCLCLRRNHPQEVCAGTTRAAGLSAPLLSSTVVSSSYHEHALALGPSCVTCRHIKEKGTTWEQARLLTVGHRQPWCEWWLWVWHRRQPLSTCVCTRVPLSA